MHQSTYKVIGLMSGTSLDGLDIAYCLFTKKAAGWFFSIQKTESIVYNDDFKEKLRNAIHINAADLLAFHNTYGSWLGKEVHRFIKKDELEIDFIASHGHTVFHQPDIGLTYQLGSGQHLAIASSYKTICDFRTKDVALGGQGAPLVPIGDKLLFHQYDFCLNLGGIGNISYQLGENRIAYDISPANMLLNYICKKIDLAYDAGGNLAAKGSINIALLDQLNTLDYYALPYPKSLGIEWFEKQIIPLIESCNDSIEVLLHTSVHHIVMQISKEVLRVGKNNATLFITGGGAKNEFLIHLLKQKLNGICNMIIPEETIIDFKEALIFAFLGVLRDRNEINCLKSVTGAIENSSSGVLFNPF